MFNNYDKFVNKITAAFKSVNSKKEVKQKLTERGMHLWVIDPVRGIHHRVRIALVIEGRRVDQVQVACRFGGQVEDVPTLLGILIWLAIGQQYLWFLADDLVMHAPDMHFRAVAKGPPQSREPFGQRPISRRAGVKWVILWSQGNEIGDPLPGLSG